MPSRDTEIKVCPSCNAPQKASLEKCPDCSSDLTNVAVIKQKIKRRYFRHLGSTIAIIYGVLEVLVSLSQMKPGHLIPGLTIILGAIAYRSARKRRLGEVENTETRLYTEISLIALILASIVFRNRSVLKQFISTQPAEALATLVIIPLWIIIAYTIMASKARKVNEWEAVDGIEDQRLIGVRGWLILPAIGIVIGLIGVIIKLINLLRVYSDFISAGYNVVYYADLITTIFLIGLLSYAAYLFYRKKRNTPYILIAFIALDIITSAILFFIGMSFGPEVYTEEYIKQVGMGYISAYIWIPYFIISKRVNDTFVN